MTDKIIEGLSLSHGFRVSRHKLRTKTMTDVKLEIVRLIGVTRSSKIDVLHL